MPTRVAYLINQYPKVSHSFIRTEILALESQGVSVTRLAMRGWDEAVADSLDIAEREKTRYVLQGGALALGLAVASVALTRPRRFVKALSASWQLSRNAERGFLYHLIYLAEACVVLRWLTEARIQHLHAHFGSNATAVALLARALGGPPYSFTVHGPEEFDKPLQWKLREKIRDAAFVVAISSFCRSQLFRWSDGEDWDKISIVHCAVDPRMRAKATTDPKPTRSIVCVGRLCEQKGQLLLLQAVAHLASRGQSVRLVLAGDGEMRAEIEQAAWQAGIADRVLITGWISADQVSALLEEATALVLPSFGEGLPVAIMEAMARCRPVITTYVAGIPELVRDGLDGVMVAAGDVSSLADAIERVLTMDDEALRKMGHAAKARVNERHCSDNEAGKLRRLFQQFAEPDGEPTRLPASST